MSIPCRYNPVDVQYLSLSVAETKHDPDFDEPKRGSAKHYGDPVTCKAQIVWGEKDKFGRSITGDPGESRGHLTFKRSVKDANNWDIKKGDIITLVAGFAVNLEVTEVKPGGHLRGKANLVLAYFEQNQNTNPSLRR